MAVKKILPPSKWRRNLRNYLSHLSIPSRSSRIAVVGVGNEFRGDDAIGSIIAQRLIRRRSLPANHLVVIDAGPAPENVLGLLRRFGPDVTLFLDATEMGRLPGSICFLQPGETIELGVSTHTISPAMLAEFLEESIGCRVALVGIQPANNAFGSPLSPFAEAAADEVLAGLTDLLAEEPDLLPEAPHPTTKAVAPPPPFLR